ncbi:MAG TPA: hypothetical protein VMY38_05930 [Gemmatimonadaceae bacterium]|nr:hypothetical protein [Gemmatimonadaceae bacterium]
MAISILGALPLALAAVAQMPDSTPVIAPDSASQRTASRPAVEVSGILFGNYQYRLNPGTGRVSNKFDLERAYITLRAPAGRNVSIRLTTDVFQQTRDDADDYYKGWTIRAKYAYLQLHFLERATAKGVVRFGLVHNVFIDYDESYWPRWISTVPTDRHGYFSSADAGIATLVTMPGKLGEVYATVTNGPGYTSRETDRFKDYAARITLTPFARVQKSLLQSLAISAWTYRGAIGSRFAEGGPGQVGPVGESLDRSRWGVFAAVRTPRAIVAAQYAAKADEGEAGDNTPAIPRTVTDSAGNLTSIYTILRPFAGRAGRAGSISLVARGDRISDHRDRRYRHDLFIGGMMLDLTSSASVSLDYQEQLPRYGSPASRSRIVFLHLVGRF